ncbi:hypothetical protein ABZ656_21610 [Streptomyces sp. NPDC007095]
MFEVVFVLALLTVSTPLLGTYMARVYGGGKAPFVTTDYGPEPNS